MGSNGSDAYPGNPPSLPPSPPPLASRLSDALRACLMDHHGQLDLNSVKELPHSYAWAQLDENPSFHCFSKETVPVIDLEDPHALQLIGRACKTWGVFQVTNHGIPEKLLHHVECAAKNLFSLPITQKLKASRSPDGVAGYGVARISSFFPKQMWYEGFTIVGSPLEHARQLWPQDHGLFCDVIEDYQREMKQLAGCLMWLMLGSLGVTKEDIEWSSLEGELTEASAALQLNSYPTCPDPARAMGLAAHTDSTLLTILHQNNTSGLQVFKEDSGWTTVPPLPGALVVNVGDLFHILSNGSYQSVLHRAAVNRVQHRLSVAYLYGPPSRVEISPLPPLTDSNHPPLYRPVTWSEYLATKAKYFNKALSLLRFHAPTDGVSDANNGIPEDDK